MKFRTKLIIGFSVIVFFISAILGIVYYQFNSKHITEMTRQNLEFYAEQLTVNMDNMVESMKQVTDYIVSDPDMLSAIQAMPRYHETGAAQERKKQGEVITSGLSLYYLNRDFYRVLVFNEMGDVFSSTNTGSGIIDRNRNISEISWLSDAAAAKGKVVLVPPHEDRWGLRGSEKVFSLARKIQGGNFGYIEVQNEAEKLESVLYVPDANVKVIVYLPDGRIFYESEKFPEQFTDYIFNMQEKFLQTGTDKGDYRIAAVHTSEKSAIRAAVVQDSQGMFADMKQVVLLSAFLALGCFVISEAVAVIIANKLSRPIMQLRDQMENTGIENLDMEPVIFNTDDEMEALSIAYQKLIRRLNEAMVKEKRISLLQLQAQFDTLQAQVNPHFIYNVLNVISNRGIVDEDEEICEICGSLAAMLRYSANNKERYATVKEEFAYLDKYIYLLKSRYEHRLEVTVDYDLSIEGEVLPKIVIQQLVENSIQHGYKNGKDIMKICVHGWRDEQGWYIRVHDNGDGITEQISLKLENKMENIRRKIMRSQSNIELEIGGMGLANTYARMFLMYTDRVIFDMKNCQDGFSITVGVRNRREDDSVSGNDCG